MVVVANFVDYLRSGYQISMNVAIDYTGSNGFYTEPYSLHFMGPSNQYEAAIRNVGGVLENYDYDRSFPVYGFGGVPKHLHQVTCNHCFAINGNPSNPSINSVFGILGEYRRTLPLIQLSGPTLFAPLLKEFNKYVSQFNGQPVY